MKHPLRTLAVGLALAGTAVTGVGLTTASASGSTTSTSTAPTTSTLVGIRAGHHPGYDRFVLEFRGPVPAQRSVAWVSRVTQDGSGATVRLAGHAFLAVRLSPAVAHDSTGARTVPGRQTFALPNLTQYALAGDFEGVVGVGLGLQRKETVHVSTLSSPSRLVIDVATPYDWVTVGDYFLDANRYAAGTRPYLVRRSRPAIPPAVARQALERLFAGVTAGERADGLRFVSSHATGFTDFSVSGGVARLRLTGGCDSNGSTFTVANEIMPTLKQFASIDHVKIYGPAGYTEQPSGTSDSIPPCLEP
jgi:hypothetical protein